MSEAVDDNNEELAGGGSGDAGELPPTEPAGGSDTREQSPPEPKSTGASPVHQSKSKIDVLLKPAGDAPIMKKKKWAVDKTKRVGWVVEFIRRYLKCETADSLFVYVNQSFAPSPDTNIGSLYECFGSDGKLVLHYCKTQAWG